MELKCLGDTRFPISEASLTKLWVKIGWQPICISSILKLILDIGWSLIGLIWSKASAFLQQWSRHHLEVCDLDKDNWENFVAICRTAARRSEINMVSSSFVTSLISSEIIIVYVQEHIDKVMEEEEEEATSHNPADLGTRPLRRRKAFVDPCTLRIRVSPASKYDWCNGTDPTAKVPHTQPYPVSHSERLELETQIAELLAKGWVTDSHIQCAAQGMLLTTLTASGLQMYVNYRGLNAITTRDQYPLP